MTLCVATTSKPTGTTSTTIEQGHKMSIYTDEGHENRRAYLDSVADEYGLTRETVYTLASILGSSEDFDGLLTACEDAADEEERAQLWASALGKGETA